MRSNGDKTDSKTVKRDSPEESRAQGSEVQHGATQGNAAQQDATQGSEVQRNAMQNSTTPAKTSVQANKIASMVVAVVVVAAVVALVIMRMGAASGVLYAYVHDADGVVHTVPLDTDSDTRIQTELGFNVVSVKDGCVFVSEADCDNHDCIHQGTIDAPGKQIICLPHKLWIEVAPESGGSGRMDVDVVASNGTAHNIASGGGETHGTQSGTDADLDVVSR